MDLLVILPAVDVKGDGRCATDTVVLFQRWLGFLASGMGLILLDCGLSVILGEF
jgi:hypothetical protein